MDVAVKVDRELLEKVERFVKENRFTYSSKKQVVNLAVIEFLKKQDFLKSESFKDKKKRGVKKS